MQTIMVLMVPHFICIEPFIFQLICYGVTEILLCCILAVRLSSPLVSEFGFWDPFVTILLSLYLALHSAGLVTRGVPGYDSMM